MELENHSWGGVMVDLFEKEHTKPWRHFTFSNLLPTAVLNELKQVPSRLFTSNHTQEDEVTGNYDEKNLRYFIINTGHKSLIDIFTNKNIVNNIQERFNRKLQYVRFTLMEIYGARNIFLHCDDPEKIVTAQIFLTNKNKQGLGTWYYNGNVLAKKLDFNDNCGHIFAPEQGITWHTVPKIEKNICRRSLLINYVSTPTEWRV